MLVPSCERTTRFDVEETPEILKGKKFTVVNRVY